MHLCKNEIVAGGNLFCLLPISRYERLKLIYFELYPSCPACSGTTGK